MLNTALADYTNTTTLNTLLAGKQDVINDLSDIRTGSQNNVKYTSQSLTDTQKEQARTNIGAGTYSKPSAGIPASDLASGVIPSSPGTLTTTSTTALSTASSEVLSGNISLHKVAKTGTYSDLVGLPTVDSTPTENSTNLVSSGGVHQYITNTLGNAKIFHGTCSTAAATTAKVVTCSDFTSEELVKGALIYVTFDYTNSGAVADITLNVNNTGAKSIKKETSSSSGGSTANLQVASQLQANNTYLFQYNGTYWVCMTMDHNTNTTYSSMTTAEIDAGTGTTAKLITPARLKHAVETWAPEPEGDFIIPIKVNDSATPWTYSTTTTASALIAANTANKRLVANFTFISMPTLNDIIYHNVVLTAFSAVGSDNPIFYAVFGISNNSSYFASQYSNSSILELYLTPSTNDTLQVTVKSPDTVPTKNSDNVITSGGVYNEIHPAVVTTQPSGGFVPNVLYNLGTLTGSKTFTLASPSDNAIVNHYYWTFTAGSTAPTITWPSGISWFGGSAPTITAGKHYDVSILDNIAVCMEV